MCKANKARMKMMAKAGKKLDALRRDRLDTKSELEKFLRSRARDLSPNEKSRLEGKLASLDEKILALENLLAGKIHMGTTRSLAKERNSLLREADTKRQLAEGLDNQISQLAIVAELLAPNIGHQMASAA